MSNMALVPVLSLADAAERYNDLSHFVQAVLHDGIDFGVIPGTNKPTLLKPGAEKLCALFALTPQFTEVETTEDWTGKDHGNEPFFYYKILCQLTKGGVVVGSCIASCNSWEERYRYRIQNRSCPECGAPALLKSKDKPEWFCWKKKGGCGFIFPLNDKRITDQPEGRVPNPNIFDQVNTFVKQAQKRAMVGATLIAANASEYFTQDMEDIIISGDWKEVSEKPEEKKVDSPKAKLETTGKYVHQSQPGDQPPMLEDDWVSPSEDSSPAPAPVVVETPWEENGIIYRKKDGGIQLKFGTDWRPTLEQAKLSPAAIKTVTDLFKDGFEMEGHLNKHFGVKKLASLNWQQVMALLNFKKKSIKHPLYYGEKAPEIQVEMPKVSEGKKSSGYNQALVDLFDPKGAVDPETLQDFMVEADKFSKPEELKVFLDAGLNLKDHGQELVSILNIVSSSPEDYPLLQGGKLSLQVKELVDHAKTSAH